MRIARDITRAQVLGRGNEDWLFSWKDEQGRNIFEGAVLGNLLPLDSFHAHQMQQAATKNIGSTPEILYSRKYSKGGSAAAWDT